MAAVMDRAVLVGQGHSLSVGAALGQGPRPGTGPANAGGRGNTVGRPFQGRHDRGPSGAGDIEPLDVVMRRHIEIALRATDGRVEGPHGAARLLKINPHTLRARMRKLKINWRAFRE
jgi:transcriptional regulator with GAF, ATPase, and Fis domain